MAKAFLQYLIIKCSIPVLPKVSAQCCQNCCYSYADLPDITSGVHAFVHFPVPVHIIIAVDPKAGCRVAALQAFACWEASSSPREQGGGESEPRQHFNVGHGDTVPNLRRRPAGKHHMRLNAKSRLLVELRSGEGEPRQHLDVKRGDAVAGLQTDVQAAPGGREGEPRHVAVAAQHALVVAPGRKVQDLHTRGHKTCN